MLISLKNLWILQVGALAVLLVHTTVSINVFEFLQFLSYAFLWLVILSFLILCVFTLQRPRMTYYGMSICVYFLLLIILSLLNGTDIKGAIYTSIEVALLLMIFYYFRDRLRLTLYTCAIVFAAITYGNLIFMLMFPDWLYQAKDSFYGYLLGGNYNQMGGRIICGLATNVLCLQFSRKWLINVIPLFIVSIFTMLLVGSMTSFTCLSLYALLCLIPTMSLKKLSVIGLFVAYLMFQVFVVFAGEGLYNNEFVAYFIEQILGKDLSFTYRTAMWASAGESFSQSPIWGYGEVDTDWYLSNMSSLAIGPHNFIYAVLLRGGIILISILIGIFTISLKQLMGGGLNPHSIKLLMAIEVWLVMSLMEVYPIFFILYLLTLAYYYPYMFASSNLEKRVIQ